MEGLQLAKQLPPRLLRFFAKYPPIQFLETAQGTVAAAAKPPSPPAAPSDPQTITTAPTTPPQDPNVPPVEQSVTSAVADAVAEQSLSSTSAPPNAPSSISSETHVPPSAFEAPYHNPFAPKKNFVTGKWRGPIFGLRKQADLCKMARRYGVEELLPYSLKRSDVREERKIARAVGTKAGAGMGDKAKGHVWERTMKNKLENRRQAMMKMPELIQQWKQRGHGKGWKKWPSGKKNKLGF